MIRGFKIETEKGTTFGVCNYAADVPDEVIIEDIVAVTGADPDCVSICCAYELIDEQYEGIAYLTTGAV